MILTGTRAGFAERKLDLSERLGQVAVPGILLGIFLQALPVPAEITVGIVGASAGLLLVGEKPLRDVWRGDGLALYLVAGAFVLLTLASTLASDAVPRSVRLGVSLLPQILLFHAVASRFSRARIDRLVWALAATGAVLACVFLATALAHPGQSPTRWMELAGLPFFSVPNDLLILVVLAPFTIKLTLAESGPALRIAAAASLIASLAALTFYQSRTGVALFVLLAAGLALAWGRPGWRRVVPVVAVCALLLVAADAATGFRTLAKFSHVETLSLRIPLWTAAWRMFLDAPWLGHGPGTFSLLYEGYLRGVHFPDWVLVYPSIHSPWAHSLYLELLAERGLAGFAAFFAAAVLAARMLRRARAPSAGGWALRLALAASGAVILLGGLSELSLLRYWFSQLLVLVLAMIVGYSNMGESEGETGA